MTAESYVPLLMTELLDAPGASHVSTSDTEWVRTLRVRPPDAEIGVDVPTVSIDYLSATPGALGTWTAVSYSTIGDGDPASETTALSIELFDAIMTPGRGIPRTQRTRRRRERTDEQDALVRNRLSCHPARGQRRRPRQVPRGHLRGGAGVSIGLLICVGAIWFAIRRLRRKRTLLEPALLAAREAGSTAYLYMVDNDVGVITVDAHRELNLFVAKKGEAHLQATAAPDSYTLDTSPYTVNTTQVVEGLHLWAWDQHAMADDRVPDATVADVTVLIIPETGIRDDKSFREQASQAIIRASAANGVGQGR